MMAVSRPAAILNSGFFTSSRLHENADEFPDLVVRVERLFIVEPALHSPRNGHELVWNRYFVERFAQTNGVRLRNR